MYDIKRYRPGGSSCVVCAARGSCSQGSGVKKTPSDVHAHHAVQLHIHAGLLRPLLHPCTPRGCKGGCRSDSGQSRVFLWPQNHPISLHPLAGVDGLNPTSYRQKKHTLMARMQRTQSLAVACNTQKHQHVHRIYQHLKLPMEAKAIQ